MSSSECHTDQLDGNTVAIVLATFNGERFLTEQLNSILEQSHKDWCIIASDDGSSDNTLGILEEFRASHPGKMIIVSHRGQGGACENFLDALNEALELTDASYFAFCDQDDYWESNKLEVSLMTIQALERDEEGPALVFSDAAVVDADLVVISQSFFDYTGVSSSRIQLNNLLVQNPISGAAMLFNRSLAETVSESHYGEQIWMHDQWVGLIAACFGKIGPINEALFKYRQHGDNAMGAIEMSWKFILEKARIAKSSLGKKQVQAKYLLRTYSEELPEEEKYVLEQFSSLDAKSKLSRIHCCMQNAFFMNGVLRNLGLMVFI